MPSDPVAKLRRETGYKNAWARKRVDDSTQVKWSDFHLRSTNGVAIIGGGISGLSCARELALNGIKSVIFDSGRRGVGGRMATRRSDDGSLDSMALTDKTHMIFDHACQFINDGNGDPRFVPLLNEWLEEGLVRPWTGPVVRISVADDGKRVREIRETIVRLRYIAPTGMRSLPESMGSRLTKEGKGLVTIQRPFWVAKMKADEEGWKLYNKKGDLGGTFDFVVIAHNGKCANSLVGPAGAPRLARQLMKLRLSAAWVLMVAFDSLPEGLNFEGCHVEGCPVLSWAKVNVSSPTSTVSCWTLISTNGYAQVNKVPQEALNREIEKKISTEMLEAFQRAIGGQLPPPSFVKCQLWGAALPLNSPLVDCLFDQDSRAVVVGDWLLGSSVASAAISGIEGARRIVRMVNGEKDLNLGLDSSFSPLSPLPIPVL